MNDYAYRCLIDYTFTSAICRSVIFAFEYIHALGNINSPQNERYRAISIKLALTHGFQHEFDLQYLMPSGMMSHRASAVNLSTTRPSPFGNIIDKSMSSLLNIDACGVTFLTDQSYKIHGLSRSEPTFGEFLISQWLHNAMIHSIDISIISRHDRASKHLSIWIYVTCADRLRIYVYVHISMTTILQWNSKIKILSNLIIVHGKTIVNDVTVSRANSARRRGEARILSEWLCHCDFTHWRL